MLHLVLQCGKGVVGVQQIADGFLRIGFCAFDLVPEFLISPRRNATRIILRKEQSKRGVVVKREADGEGVGGVKRRVVSSLSRYSRVAGGEILARPFDSRRASFVAD